MVRYRCQYKQSQQKQCFLTVPDSRRKKGVKTNKINEKHNLQYERNKENAV